MAVPTKDILAAIEKGQQTAARSSLSRWMRRHHDELLARLGERPDWTALAQLFEEGGLTDRSGKPASPETARKAWQRVRKAVAEARARRPAQPPATPAKAPEPSPTKPTEDDDDFIKTVGGPRIWTNHPDKKDDPSDG